ncbi:deoxyguanosinetriphosphate triphosphohydrolase family protein [Tunturiibacter gelidoferens]|uniref:dGTPase n=1 Tax=Tunturiibacter lichenicola TaxID=2051959 RepID=A0A7Y9TBJ4_9BACT|nr:dGTPase [Edaphobacter lichenicola]
MRSIAGQSRLVPEPPRDGDDRNDFQRDRDSILYSSALQRLSTTTQVVSGEQGRVFHNRLTHSLQVAQVGRRLAEKLKLKQPALATRYGLNEDVVEAACLAHDLGHPPFGHLAEIMLDKLASESKGVQGFEGNAQSFRIVTVLAFRSEKFEGLNLTKQTLRAILKYPWTYSAKRSDEKRKKWGTYDSELDIFQAAVGKRGKGPYPRSVEAELMDWADDLTYAIHDAEDFYRAGLIPLHLLRYVSGMANSSERDNFLDYVSSKKTKISELRNCSNEDLDSMLRELLATFFKLSGPYQGTREDRSKLRTFTSELVGRYINGIKLIAEDSDGKKVSAGKELQKEIALLKQLTWYYVIDGPGLALQQHAQRKIIEDLYKTFLNEARRDSPSYLLPPYCRDRLKKKEKDNRDSPERVVVDLIAGMTESQTLLTYQKLNGVVMPSGLEHWVL